MDNDDLRRRVQRLEDLEAIRRLKARYARYCDAGYDPEGIAGLFVEDGVWDGGDLFGRAEGTEEIKAHFRGASSRIPWALHFPLVPDIDISDDGTTATGTWYLWQPCTVNRSTGPVGAWLVGTYRDRYVKVEGEWRFLELRVDARWL